MSDAYNDSGMMISMTGLHECEREAWIVTEVRITLTIEIELGLTPSLSHRFNATPFEDPLFYLLSIASAYIHIS